MSNLEKYKNAFCESFSINENDIDDNLEYNSINAWDSVGHMGLIANLEEAFNISFEIDDVIDFSSYNKGKEILKKYKIEV